MGCLKGSEPSPGCAKPKSPMFGSVRNDLSRPKLLHDRRIDRPSSIFRGKGISACFGTKSSITDGSSNPTKISSDLRSTIEFVVSPHQRQA